MRRLVVALLFALGVGLPVWAQSDLPPYENPDHWLEAQPGVEAYEAGDADGAWNLLSEPSVRGNLRATHYLALISREAEDAWNRPEDRYSVIRAVADQGYAPAQYEMGLMYRDGQYAPQIVVKAASWFSLAAEQGHIEAGRVLAELRLQGKVSTAIDESEVGDGLTKIRDAAGQFKIAMRFYESDSVARNLEKAASWFRKAAKQGYVPAYIRLGMMHQQGEGVALDLYEAFWWYRHAADADDAEAYYLLARLFEFSQGDLHNPGKAKMRYFTAAHLGHPDAQYWSGQYFERWMHTNTTYVGVAKSFYESAAKQGHLGARDRLQALPD